MTTQLTGFELLPEEFTLSQLQNLYEGILGLSLDKRNFRRKVLSHDVIIDLNKPLQPYEGSGKAPMLHKLDRKKYDKLKAEGYRFELF
jgi:8-oxo-dGTP diphosphatase